MARDYGVCALGLAPWQGLTLDSAGRWKVSLADEILSLPFHTFKTNVVASPSKEGRTVREDINTGGGSNHARIFWPPF